MRRSRLHPLVCVVGLFATSPALAAPGPHLSWDHCWGDGQVVNKAFGCNTNLGVEALVLSFESPLASTDRVGLEVVLYIASSSASVPAWWLVGSGACRSGALSITLTPDPASACAYPYADPYLGAVAAPDVGFYGPNSMRLRALSAVQSATPFTVGPGIEDFAFRINLSHIHTLGTGACAGCDVPLCIGVGYVKVVGVIPGDDIALLAGSPNSGGGPANVTWQGAYTHDFTFTTLIQNGSAQLTCDPTGPVPALRSTWGAVKSLYR